MRFKRIYEYISLTFPINQACRRNVINYNTLQLYLRISLLFWSCRHVLYNMMTVCNIISKMYQKISFQLKFNENKLYIEFVKTATHKQYLSIIYIYIYIYIDRNPFLHIIKRAFNSFKKYEINDTNQQITMNADNSFLKFCV